ncbi:anthranilate synthase component II [Pontibacillus litoralis]|uniref:Anthranilate synthase subunit II n=1 Tax=Pontibacillus litoralis JSM 072002 TaxID=1385512 RepID=A0A0A5G7Y6_9BACI|nr:aminodeoxychorismate/anthranilate synthase component II [Pontibacillus litoralis]KGX88144.1 anthranilate synthase subunit II [Pontibacillus litoralis JSM 072002]
MILVIDNYDSFSYNLVQYLGEIQHELNVRRNDEVTIAEIEQLQPNIIVLSPGPCTPNEAGICLDVVRKFAGVIPILGVCLGHQAIVQAFGGSISRVQSLYHGKTSQIDHDGGTIYSNLPNPLTVGRYHSLIATESSLPACLTITATTDCGEIMGVRHVTKQIEGVQFHPESILTEHGKRIIHNFVKYYLQEKASTT